MKTRRLGDGLRLMLAALTLLAAGCGATSVNDAEKSATQPEAPAPSAPAPTAVAETAEPAVQRSQRPNAPLPDEITKVVQLVESGAGEDVVRAYVGASNARYDLSLDQIIYLRDIGVSDGVIAAMMRRGSELREKDAESAALQTNLVAAAGQIKEGLAAGATAPPPAPGTEAVGAPEAPPVAVQGVQAPAEAPVPVQQFYEPLSPYGTWYQVPTYGWVWQPSVVVVDSTWMPYRHGGRWVWSDSGWYWCSDYSWGWAPFHYGRWCTYPGMGWCWVPDTVWGPSWVTWRHSDSHFGWAPLPPACGWSSGVGLTWYGNGVSVGFGFGLASSCYTFVPSARFCNRNLAHYAVHGGEHDGAFHRSTVVNNVGHENNGVVNNGLGYTQVASRVRDEIPKARVQPLPAESRQSLRVDKLERSKDGFVVYRPTPVENAGGRPALRAEVKPVAPVSGPAGRSVAGSSARPESATRFATGGSGSMKPGETRGAAYGASSPGSVTPSTGARPLSTPSRSSVARPYSTVVPRATEARALDPNGQAVTTGHSGTPTVAPVRQTAPVPLADPSRNIPAGMRAPARGTVASPGRTDYSRPGSVYSGAAPVPGQVNTVPRTSYSAPSPNLAAPRSSYSMPAAPSAPVRPTYSMPSPSASVPSPSYGAPRQSYSAPMPAMSAPSPSYSAPRQSYSAPAPSSAPTAAPSGAPAGSSPSRSSSGGSGNRNQPN